jgi:hypothetical protein
MRRLALMAMLATVMLVFTSKAVVAQEKARVAPAEETTKAEMKEAGATANVLLDDKRARVGDVQIKRGDRTRFSGLVPIGAD